MAYMNDKTNLKITSPSKYQFNFQDPALLLKYSHLGLFPRSENYIYGTLQITYMELYKV